VTIYGRTFAAHVRGAVDISLSETGHSIIIATDAMFVSIERQPLALETPHRVKAFTDQSGRVVTIQRTA